ncbi:hypothetical protein IF1G_06283 [Cordyceps javanica]|uniref:Uncharacterized protein n=1 Tax=Cordyceps javanica TaxID=43265 RepID=A0A545V0Q2_9HYPO|nr:hypothetical protein IF1G_06283 [Cordyceps javanica]
MVIYACKYLASCFRETTRQDGRVITSNKTFTMLLPGLACRGTVGKKFLHETTARELSSYLSISRPMQLRLCYRALPT